jgi:hypothetical protein
MVADLGEDGFAEFWGSAAPVSEAFEAASGRPLGEWYRAQVKTELRAAGLPEPLEPPFWPSALGFLALAVVGTIWQAGRRQVR